MNGHLAEHSGGDHASASANTGGSMNMHGFGSVTLGGPLSGQVFPSNPARGDAVILTARSDGFSCTGHFDTLPTRDQSVSTPIHCTNGLNDSTILKNSGGRYLLPFSAGGNGGLVDFR